VVNVASQALAPAPGLREVKAFPKDLRAEHGFDNQANQLTLSPLLLDAFLRLSVSIVESPDFAAANVGVWNELFAPPAADADLRPEIERRLSRFLRRAFRGPVEPETIARYQGFVEAKMMQGMPFTDAMKKLASAVLCSPRFLYRAPAATADETQFELASRLSFFLWSSGPDDELLELAARGKLSDGTTLRTTIDRMLADPKVERFLDSFPTQWLQLENVLAATPDPQKSRYFNLDPRNPAALQMLLEPLLTFDQVFIENRSIAELVAPESSYRSDFLRDWYESPLQPPPFDPAAVVAENERLDQRRKLLAATVKSAESELDSLVTPVRERLLEAKKKAEANSPDAAKRAVADLKPYAAWEFNGDLNDAIGDLHLKAHGEISYQDGRVSLDRAYLLSAPLKVDLTAKTLEIWFQLSKLDQRGGGLMGIQGPGDFFDTIVIGERKPLHW
ncbi:MAG TPA: DUF1592 domain-containing protein, partial [Pirellulaceae bacterium]|nr:DUF1592 domain-containing protein [Pirellulaceae bacterium]